MSLLPCLGAAALAKLKDGRTFAEEATSIEEIRAGVAPGEGVLVLAFRSEAVRELVLDIECPTRSRLRSCPFSRRSLISFSLEDTSTGLPVTSEIVQSQK